VTFVVGLTGGIGSGKSAVAAAFAARGAAVADADAIVHDLSRAGAEGHRAIAAEFGAAAITPAGALDRAWLRRRAFADGAFRARLEAILHPLVRAEIDRQVAGWDEPYGLIVVPLLLERGGLSDRVARVLVVDCPEEEQVRRVGLRSGLAPDEVRAIMATQVSRAERLARADDVIDNSGPLAALAPQVDALDARYRALAVANRRKLP
jgi:dephospho-CoA kinase